MARSSTSQDRLSREFREWERNPPPFIAAVPLSTNIHEWFFLLCGPPNTPFQGGFYLGKLVFPPSYPFMPPSIFMLTPSGRFATNTRICTSMSDFHPQSWSPMWRVSTILVGFLSFMLEHEETVGCVHTTDEEKRRLAAESLGFNQQGQFARVFDYLLGRLLSRNSNGEGAPGGS